MQQVERNESCPCGSGKKYKNCCMDKQSAKLLNSKKRFVYIAIIVIIVLSISLRFYGFQQPHGLTFDEGLYADLIAEQLRQDPRNYSTQEAYQVQLALGQHVPEYLDRPLFKHPPLYGYLIALNYQIFGSSQLSAVSVSILFGCLMIFIVFLLGSELYDYRVGLLSALFLCMDPVHWVCSERIWMETTMSFFILLAVYLFVLGQKQKIFLPFCGLSAGLAMLTKYPGVLSLLIIISFAALYNRTLFKQRNFWILLFLSFLVFSPWIIWNWNVYGSFFNSIIPTHDLSDKIARSGQSLLEFKGLLMIFLFGGGIAVVMRNKIASWNSKTVTFFCFLIFVCALTVIPFLRAMFIESFAWNDTVLVGWSNPFSMGPWHFYLTRLNELSPLYLFSFLSIFFVFGRDRGDQLLLLSSLLILGAFIFLGNYQSRYILPAVPFLILLSARFQIMMYDQLLLKDGEIQGSSNLEILRPMLKVVLVGIGLYFIVKTLRTDWLIAIGPDFGYF